MHQSRQVQLQPPFKRSNIASSSLEGMERPVRSFKSFMRFVPANPSESKPLPPAPAKESSSRSTSRERSSSIYSRAINSWEAPASWRSRSNEPSPQSTTIYLQPTTFGPGDSQSPAVNQSLPPVSEPRTYSPILPDLSTDLTKPNMDLGATIPSESISANQSKPNTVPEGINSDLCASYAPPESPLPLPPVNIALESLGKPLPPSPLQELPVTNLKHLKTEYKTEIVQIPPIISFRTVSSASSTPSKPPPPRTFPPDKALVSLGLETTAPPAMPKRNVTRSRRTPPRSHDYVHYNPIERRLETSKTRGVNSNNLADDDSWEDEDMDERQMQMSYAEDYHNQLVDQYRGLTVFDHYADEGGWAHVDRHDGYVQIPELIPRPLSWNKVPAGEQRSNGNVNIVVEKSDERATSRGRFLRETFKMPLRLSLASKVQKHDNAGKGFRIPLSQRQETISSASMKNGKGGIGVRKSPRCQPANPEHRLSAFYPRKKPLTSPKKHNKKSKQKAEHIPPLPLILPIPLTSSPPVDPALLPPFAPRQTSLHSPAQTASIRPASRSILDSVKKPESIARRRPLEAPPTAALQEPKISLKSNLRASSSPQYSSSHPENMERGAPISNPSTSHAHSRKASLASLSTSKALTDVRTAYDRLRASLGSASTHSGSLSRPFFVHEGLVASFSSHAEPVSPRLAPSSWRMAHPDEDDEAQHKLSFFEKVLEARKKRNREIKQEKLKRSIRVLGPTDPRSIEGYGRDNFGGRRPGYMAEGFMG